MWDEKSLLEQKAVGFDGLIKHKVKYKGYTVYEPYSIKRLALGYPRFYLVKGDIAKSSEPEEFGKILNFLIANNEFDFSEEAERTIN